MHLISLGISRMFTECLWNFLCDYTRTSQALESTTETHEKSFSSLLRLILEIQTFFVDNATKNSSGLLVRVTNIIKSNRKLSLRPLN